MTELIASSLRLAVPLLFAAMGGFLCERSGVATICLEGVMLMGAWVAAAVTYWTHNLTLGLLLGLVAGSLMMGLHAFLSVTARADQIVSGVAVNILAAGLTPLFNKCFFGSSTSSPEIPFAERFHEWGVPLLDKIPQLGELFFRQMPLAYLALLLPFLLHGFAYHTGFGLRLLSSGDGPDALQTAGVNPSRTRYLALLAGGAIAALGGVYLSTSHASSFTRDMTAGRGYIALTALIFGGWRPIPAAMACLFFGFADALQIQLQGTVLFGVTIPVQFIQCFPYFVTLVVLVVVGAKSRPPLSIGVRNPTGG